MVERWLLKTEPEEWSWEDQQANGGISHWDGVRNALAQKHLRAMEPGDLCFFYHSGAKAKEIVGIARVCKPFYPDPTDDSCKHGMVDIEAVSQLSQPLSLARLKQEEGLHNFLMFRQPRLSVVPVSSSEWNLICELAGELEPPLLPDYGANVNKQALGLANGQGKVINSLTEPKPSHNTRVKVRVSDQTAECDYGDMPPQSSPKVKRQPRKSKSHVNPTNVKVKESTPPAEDCHVVESALDNSLRTDFAKVLSAADVKEDNDALFPLSDSITTKAVPDTKRVYSRQRKKQGQVESLNTIAEMNDCRDMASADAGRVYKRRNR